MSILSGGLLHQLEVDDPEMKSLIARYWGVAIQHFRDTGDTSKLAPYRGRTVDGIPFDTDPDVIEDWLIDTDFDFQDLYEP
jgi:hypothetical protein